MISFSWLLAIVGIAHPVMLGPVTNEFEIADCTVQLLAEIDVPALSSGRLTAVEIKVYQSVNAMDPLAKLDDQLLQDRIKVATVRRQLLTNQLASELQDKIAITTYRDAKAQHDANLNMQAASPASVPALELSRSQLSLQRSELEIKRVAETKADLRLELNIQVAEIASIEGLINELTVVSPVTGTVLSVEKQTGEWVQIGETVARVAPMDRLLIPVLLPEYRLLQRHAAGTSVTVRWQERDVTHALRGRIVGVDPQFRGKDQYRVHVEVENRKLEGGWLLLPGRRVNVTFYPDEAKAAEVAEVAPATKRLLQPPDNFRPQSFR
jgi:multidrug resistance efflux pump